MKKIGLFLLAGLLCSAALFGQKKLSAAEIEFEFVSKGVDGTIKGFQSTSSIDTEDISKSFFKGSVEVATIRTGIFLRDWSLKGKKYFNEDQYPRILFESTSISQNDNGFEVTGNLTIKGITKAVSFDFEREANKLTGTASINSADFGIRIVKKRLEDNLVKVRLVLQLE